MTLELNEDGSIKLRLSTGSGPGGSYAGNHNALSGRDAPACHPIGAIDGLAGILETLRSAVAGSASAEALDAVADQLADLAEQVGDADRGLASRLTSLEAVVRTIHNYDDTEIRRRLEDVEDYVGNAPHIIVDGYDSDRIVFEGDGALPDYPEVTYATVAALEVVDSYIDTEIRDRREADASIRQDFAAADSSVLASAMAYADGKVSTILRPKGSITNAALAALTDMRQGDMWDVVDDGAFPAGANVWWTGNAWDEFAARMDMSRYDAHLASRNNPHGVTAEQIMSAPQLAAIDSGITADRLAVIDGAVAKVSTVEEGAERNAVDGIKAGGALLPADAGRNVLLDGLIVVDGEAKPWTMLLIGD